MPICKSCNIDKPTNAYHTTGKSKTLKKECKNCINTKRRAQRKENPEKYKEQDKKDYEKHKEKRKQAANEYRLANIEAVKNRKAEYYENNKSKIQAKYREYYAENKERILNNSHEYYKNNKEQILLYKKQYRQTEQGKLAAKNGRNNRRAREKSACDNTVTSSALKEIADKQGNKCYFCSIDIDVKSSSSHVEHLTPLSKGGLHSVSNVVWSCASCNLKKNNKTEKEYNEYLSTYTSTGTG